MGSGKFRLPILHALMAVLLGCSGLESGTGAESLAPRATSERPAPDTKFDGPWRLRASAKSFLEGPLGTIDSRIVIEAGRFRSSFRDGSFDMAISFQALAGSITGQMAVAPGMAWDTVSIPFQGKVIDGVLELRLSGTTGVQRFGIFRGERDTRTIDLHFRLDRL